ncbi:MAG: response regulator [Planctomycetaceae bacterium]
MPFRNILIVDGNSDAAARLSRTLSALGYHVEVAATGAAALLLARGDRFEIGIISEVLPDGDGYSLFSSIAQLQRGLRGILVAAVGNLTTVCNAIAAGMQRVVIRPIDIGELLPLVEESLQPSPETTPTAVSNILLDEEGIAGLTSEEIRYRLSRDELIGIIRDVEYPFAGKDRLQFFDRDTLERVVHLIRRWCQSRVAVLQ